MQAAALGGRGLRLGTQEGPLRDLIPPPSSLPPAARGRARGWGCGRTLASSHATSLRGTASDMADDQPKKKKKNRQGKEKTRARGDGEGEKT